MNPTNRIKTTSILAAIALAGLVLAPGPARADTISLSSPTSRHIVQRSAADTGEIEISGTFTGTPDRIEARAVVMERGRNSGTTTAWQSIDDAPAGGNFRGTLAEVPAGGWYQLEVRSVTGDTFGPATRLQKIGVGDIYLTTGQSNSANHGAPPFTPREDRVSVRTAVSGSDWRHGFDPMPIATGGGGSVWSRLGDELAIAENIPIGFLCVGVGATQVSQWVPGTSHYESRLKPAIRSLGRNGFRAVLWHQGESDALAGVSAATHATRLNAMIFQSRRDAGWEAPWYLAEVSFHPSSNLAQEEPVTAGQRRVVHGDPLTFLGPSTDQFHLEDAAGGKLSDTVHFNGAGLLDHARQWRDILRGTTTTMPRNGDFEDNRDPAITGLSPLADGVSQIVSITNPDSPSIIGWRVLSARGTAAANGANGIHNPGARAYAGAADTTNNGELPNMAGRHVAVLEGGSAGNFFLHSTRSLARPNTTYTLAVAIGVRDNPAGFGGARIDILAGGAVVAEASFEKDDLDALHGSDASGSFTDASVSWTTEDTVAAGQLLEIRITKNRGADTVLDFDQVRFTAVPSTGFGAWIEGFGLDPAHRAFGDDPDRDGLGNGLEAWLGTDPGRWNAGITGLSSDRTATTFTHPQNPSPPAGVSGTYQWSPNLADWYASGSGPEGGPTVTIIPQTDGSTTTVTATSSEVLANLFLRLVTTL